MIPLAINQSIINQTTGCLIRFCLLINLQFSHLCYDDYIASRHSHTLAMIVKVSPSLLGDVQLDADGISCPLGLLNCMLALNGFKFKIGTNTLAASFMEKAYLKSFMILFCLIPPTPCEFTKDRCLPKIPSVQFHGISASI